MPLLPGTRLGPYEVIAPLGAGGMGEVYRARDARLGRDVAIKVLPAALAAHADRLARFEQEARATGALNHPNILAIHDIGAHEGTPYLVSELLEGETLRERLAEGALPVRKAIDLLAQAARGLAAAHERGIVHRDLKPENLFLTRDGRMKILDFGLAKLTQPEASPAGPVSSLPTTPAGTEAGVIMGTVGYMAPEQVRGHPADARADLFALGACLYEALTGRRAFNGDSAVEVMHAILKTDPPNVATLDASLPATLDRIVAHCLEKNPEERYQTARDVAFSLETLAGASSATGAPAALTQGTRRTWLIAGIALGAAVLVAAVGTLGSGLGRTTAAGPPVFTRLTFRHGFIHSARFANAGRSIVFGAAWDGQPMDIYLGQPGSPEMRPLGLSGRNVLAVSPSDELAVVRIERTPSNLYRASGTLARVPLNGGTPRDVAEAVSYADWAPDGTHLAVIRDLRDRRSLEYPVGTVVYETPHYLFNPRISPDGKMVAFWEVVSVGVKNSVMLLDASGSVRALSPDWADWWYLSWSPDGREIWFGASTIGFESTVYAVDLAGHRRALYSGPGAYDVQDVLPDGRALLGAVRQRYRVVGALGRWDGPRDLSWFDGTRCIDIAADGTAMLLSEESVAAGSDGSVYLQREDGAPPVRLGTGRALALSPDGRQALAFRSQRDLVLLPIGAGAERLLVSGTFEAVFDGRFLPDGRRIAVLATQAGQRGRLFLVDALDGGSTPLEDIGFDTLGTIAVSPDGRRIAAIAADGRVALVPSAGGPPVFENGLRPGDLPIAWSSDGAAVYVYRRESVPTAVERLDLRTGRRQVWKELMVPDPAGVSSLQRVVMTPDARAWGYSWQQFLTDLYLVEGLK